MASDGGPVKIPAASLVHGSQAQTVSVKVASGKSLPPGGNKAAASAAQAAKEQSAREAAKAEAKVNNAASLDALVRQLNKHLNDSGRPDQYRMDPSSDNKVIQQINPASGDVIGEFSALEFPLLARAVGMTGGALIDEQA